MRRAEFHFLLSGRGAELLAETAAVGITPDNHLSIVERLRREVEPEQAQAIVETALLRQRAAVKFSRADKMFFTRPALEQASAEVVSRHRAKRFTAAGLKRIADLGCSIGGDSLALAAGAEVVGVDHDEVRLAMAQVNVAVYDQGEQFQPVLADLRELSPLAVDGVFFDPGRRDEQGRRIYSVEAYEPPLSLLEQWRAKVPHVAAKVSPGIRYEEIPEAAEVEFVSLGGEVKEGVLWFGALRSEARRRATLLPGGHTLTDGMVGVGEVARPKRFLYEPDGAVIRAHLIEQLAAQLSASKIDPEIAYLTADEYRPTTFARCYEIEDVMPFQLKRLRHYLRERNVGEVTIKKRGSPLEPERLRQQLRLQGEEQRVIFLTRVQGEPAVLIGKLIADG